MYSIATDCYLEQPWQREYLLIYSFKLKSAFASSARYCFVAKWCILQQKCLKKWIRNTMIQPSNHYNTGPESHTMHSVTDALASPAMRHWGTFTPRLPTVYFNLWGVTSQPHKLLTFNSMWLPIQWNSIQVYSFVTFYCMNFIIFLCAALKLLSQFRDHPRTNSWRRHRKGRRTTLWRQCRSH